MQCLDKKLAVIILKNYSVAQCTYSPVQLPSHPKEIWSAEICGIASRVTACLFS